MIRNVVLFMPRVICAVTCVAIVIIASPVLALFGRGEDPSATRTSARSGRTEES